MWEKLAWDVDVFQDIQRSYPTEEQPLLYSAINVCISAWSLEQWTLAAWTQHLRDRGEAPSRQKFDQLVLSYVPEHPICSAIANTAKHAAYRDGGWPDGEVSLSWADGDEDVPPSFILYHLSPGGVSQTLAFNTFGQVQSNWWRLLVSIGFAHGDQPSPKWMQNKLRRIFGEPNRLLPAVD